MITIVGAALDLGQGRRGVDMGPSAIRYGGLAAELEALGHRVDDRGNIEADELERLDVGDPSARYLRAIVRYCEHLAAVVGQSVAEGAIPLVLGGDHSLAIGVLGGLARAHGAPGAVIWVDAHGDLNTPETSPSGNVHGMPMAAAIGAAGAGFASSAWPIPMIDADRSTLIGLRSLDAGEKALLHDSALTAVTMSEIDRQGMAAVVTEAIERARGAAWLHLSFDLDAIDPQYAPGVGTPVPGGLSLREAHLLMEEVALSGLAGSFQMVEVNPILDEHNRTGALAVELIRSALGARTL